MRMTVFASSAMLGLCVTMTMVKPEIIQNLPAGFLIQSAGWLVQKQNLGVLGKRPRNGHALLLAAGKAGWGCVHFGLQPDGTDDVRVRPVTGKVCAHAHVFCHSHMRKQVVLLKDKTYGLSAEPGQLGIRSFGDVQTAIRHGSAVWPFQPGEDVQQCGLPRPGGPQNYGKISRNNFQADLLQNNLFVRSASIRFDKINCLDHVGSPFRVRSKLVNTSVSRVWIPSDVNAQVWVAQSAAIPWV